VSGRRATEHLSELRGTLALGESLQQEAEVQLHVGTQHGGFSLAGQPVGGSTCRTTHHTSQDHRTKPRSEGKPTSVSPAALPHDEDSQTTVIIASRIPILQIPVQLTTGGAVVRIVAGRTRLRDLHHVVVHKLSLDASSVCKRELSLKTKPNGELCTSTCSLSDDV